MDNAAPVFVDTKIVIEAVRTGCWKTITGRCHVVTVEECADELRRGDASAAGYVPVTEQDIDRMTVEALTHRDEVEFRLAYAEADGLDTGERDLLALAYGWEGEFFSCGCDKAFVVAAYTLGWMDQVISLEVLAEDAGARPNPRLGRQYTESRMGEWRTSLLMGGPI
jgi:hypothetical protein